MIIVGLYFDFFIYFILLSFYLEQNTLFTMKRNFWKRHAINDIFLELITVSNLNCFKLNTKVYN